MAAQLVWCAMPVDVKTILDDEIRITFPSAMSLDGLSILTNYTFFPSSARVSKVLIPSNLGSTVKYVDLCVHGIETEKTYVLTIQNLKLSSGSSLGTKIVTFSATITKAERIISGLPGMYDTSVESNMRHVLTAIGLGDELIGGATRSLRVQ